MENPPYGQVKVKKNKCLPSACFAALLLCSFEVAVCPARSKSQTVVPDGWPARLDKRKPYPSEYGFIYAGSKSAAVQVNKLIRKVVKELGEHDIEKTTSALILVMDKKEKPLLDLQNIIKIVQEADKQQQNERSKDALQSVIEAKEKIEKEGIDMDVLLSIVPMPIEPNLLPEIVNKFPQDLDRQIDFCVIVPTDRNIKTGMRKILEAAMKKQKIGIVERIIILPFMPLIEQKIVDGMKKARQLVLYQLLLAKQQGLTEKQKKHKIEAYKEKLGLGENTAPKGKTQHTGQTKETSDTTQ